MTTHDAKKINIMTASQAMAMEFTPVFAITTGGWHHSFPALRKNRECVIAIATVDLVGKVVRVGACTGVNANKFAKFQRTPLRAKIVNA